MTIVTAAEATLSIGTTAAATDASSFGSDTYVPVGEIEDLGEFGDEAEEVTFTSLSDARVRKLKGPRNAGTMQLVVGADISDTGQAALIAAEAQPLDYNFKVQLNDKLTIGGTGTIYYFRGKVMSKRLQAGQANNVVRQRFNIGINTAIVVVSAT